VKKLISIGVALALLIVVAVPGAVAAAPITPDTFAKIPFAIVGTGIQLVGDLLNILADPMGLPDWLNSNVTEPIAQWTAGPLAWSVDMLAWGAALLGDIMNLLPSSILDTIPVDLEGLCNTIACGLLQAYQIVTTNMTLECANLTG
jgi:hypothetical protein